MDFALSGPQMKLRDEVRRFAEEEVAPQVPSLDEKGEFPLAPVKRLAQLGLIGLFVPREYGGRGLGFLAATLAREEVSRVYPPLGFFYEGNDAGLYMLYSSGSEEQKRRYLPPVCRGEKLTCFALTEASGGSDPLGLQTTAEAGGEGFVVNGRKVFITLGEVADYCVFVARAGDRFNAFVVEKGGEHKDELNLKVKGVALIVDIIRIFALEKGLRETSTLERIETLRDKHTIVGEYADDFEHALEFLMLLRIHHQYEQLRSGKAPDNFINPNTLSNLEKRSLKETFNLISKVQNMIIERYKSFIW